MNVITLEQEIGGRKLSLETGRVAEQAGGAVLARYGDTVVLATVCSSEARDDIDFFPLTVEYAERLYAGGRIHTSRFIKREGRPSEGATLAARVIDRSIRPFFPKDFYNEVQVIVTVLSIDGENDADILAVIATSAAIAISDIPWKGPVGAVRMGFSKSGEYMVNPGSAAQASSRLELTLSGSVDAVSMVEAGAQEITEDEMLEAMNLGHGQIQSIVSLIEQFVEKAGKPKFAYETKQMDVSLEAEIATYVEEHIGTSLLTPDKMSREDAVSDFSKEVFAQFSDRSTKKEMAGVVYKMVKKLVRQQILEKKTRVDGRQLTEVRPIWSQVGVLPRTHGSALFTRGQTQVLSVVTLGSTSLEQIIDGMYGESTKRYIHHYNFPPFSVGEVKRIGSVGRREIGHGALAERALVPVIPSVEEFPYMMRVVSETLSSNGSSSMASVCGSTLSLMDAGVPIKAPVSGIAMGLITDGDSYVILSDIQGIEDFMGDMDFKITGTEQGITALQLDAKITGISAQILREALYQAREGRMHILGKMMETLQEVRIEMSQFAPRVEMIKINPKLIGLVIGPGGKMINQIIADTGAQIDIEDDGSVSVSSDNPDGLRRAIESIRSLTQEIEVGQEFTGKVVKIMDFGAFVELTPGKDGMVHISELDFNRVEKVTDVLNMGDMVRVKVMKIDDQGRINLSRKALLTREAA
jgi:polyribonucleotide nucleotidyltransferase